MQCLSCRANNHATNAFCEACGAPLCVICSACGNASRIAGRFCGYCGNQLDNAAAASLNSRLRALSASGGEYKWLTVLFADIQNSTGLIANLDPEGAAHRIQPALDAMRDAVHRYDGLVNKVQGDGVMALFGAPRPHEDHAIRGCLAALAMRGAVARLGDPELQIRVGLHTGEVLVQAVSNTLYQTYDAAGVVVHLANRLESIAESGVILISGNTLAESKQFIDAKSLGPRQIRGIPKPVEVFALTGSRPAPASERFRSGPRSSQLCGRKKEFETLESVLAKTKQIDAQVANVIGVVGEAGLGKSRLCFEFAESCRRRGIRVHEAHVLSHGRATPFQPIVELLRNVFYIQPRDTIDVARQRVIEALQTRGDFSESLPSLLEFLNLHDPMQPVSKQDPAARKHQLLAFVRQLIHSRPIDDAVLILIEDLHWIDEASEEFVEAMVDAVVGTRTLLLLNFRPGYVAPWMHRSHYQQLSLGPLNDTEVNELLAGLLGTDSSLVLLSRNIAERAQGNPFFLEELVQSLVERGEFEGDRGAYRLTNGIDVIPLPTTVQAVLSARIDRLADSSRQVLQIAAVIGREVPIAILGRVAKLPADELSEALLRLRLTELLYEPPPFSREVHAFRHPLIQDVAYQSLPQSRRRELHGEVARAISTHFAEQLDAHSSLIAFHLEQAGDLAQAAQAHARAAMWVGAKDPSQALRSWRKTRALLLSQSHSEITDDLRMMACGQIVNFGWREGISVDDGRTYFEEAKQIAVATGNIRANAMLHAGFGRLIAVRGSADEYVAKVLHAVALAKQANDSSLEVMLKAGLCHALRLSGRLFAAVEINVEASNRADEVNKFHRQVLGFDIEPWLTALRGQLLVMLGRYDEAKPFLDRIIQMDPGQINVADHVMPSISYVDLAWAKGDVQLAQQHSERAFTMARRSGNPYLQSYATACRGLFQIIAGRPGVAVEDLSAAIQFAHRRRAGLEYEPRMQADLANAYLLNGDLSAALRTADDAIRVSSERHTRIAECFARVVRAQTLWMAENDGAAESEVQRAEALIEETGALLYAPLLRNLKVKMASFDRVLDNNSRAVGQSGQDTKPGPRQRRGGAE
jgi:class 3 adenylate cyclase/tetratricopeptide (TPR) repeat protein